MEQLILLLLGVFSIYLLIDVLSIFIVGLYNMTDEDMILYRVSKVFEKVLGEWYSKPFFGCPVCMPSVYIVLPLSILSCVFGYLFSSLLGGVLGVIFSVFIGIAVSGKVFMMYSKLNKDKSVEDYYDNLNDQLNN